MSNRGRGARFAGAGMPTTALTRAAMAAMAATVAMVVTIAMAAPAAFAGHGGDWHVTERISVAVDGTPAEGAEFNVSVDATGLVVAFDSFSSNLVEGDTNQLQDVFVRNRRTGETQRVSVSSDGVQTRPAPGPWGGSENPAVSADGTAVAFVSSADNLVPGDTNFRNESQPGLDVFVRDLAAGTTERVSVAGDGTQANGDSGSERVDISGDGNVVVFASTATNLDPRDTSEDLDIFARDRRSGVTELISVADDESPALGESRAPSISDDGRFVAFVSDAVLVPGDTNGQPDVFVRDRVDGTTEPVSVSEQGQSNGPSGTAVISGDGGTVVFTSAADDLVPSDTNGLSDLFAHDRATGRTTRVNVDSSGDQVDDDLFGAPLAPSVSADGQVVAFISAATDLVAGDTNGLEDVFVHDRRTGETEIANVGPDGRQAQPDFDFQGGVHDAEISGDATTVAFSQAFYDFLTGENTETSRVFVSERTDAPPTGPRCTIRGTSGDDVLRGTEGDDVICAGAGDDLVFAGAGDDVVFGQVGDDRLVARPGGDRLFGGSGDDHLQGDAGRDVLDGGSGGDRLWGGGGQDRLLGGRGTTTCAAAAVATALTGGAGDDTVFGDPGDDRLDGNAGDDLLHGSQGDDVMRGGDSDVCNGAAGADVASGCERLLNLPDGPAAGVDVAWGCKRLLNLP